MINRLRRYAHSLSIIPELCARTKAIERNLETVRTAIGRVEGRQISARNTSDFKQAEFQVHSQWGEDGLLQYLTTHVAISHKTFVEFGVENYTESNTRFLMINNGWSGLVLDGDKKNIDFIKRDPIYWRHNLKAVHSFVTRENINQLLEENGIVGEIGLLSIDIDGNDYWVWDAISGVDPAIVVVEYNSLFGPDRAVTIPYDPGFMRSKAHYSHVYYGASLAALVHLGYRKRFAFVGTNSGGHNAFFVRRSLLPSHIKELTATEGYIAHKFREARDRQGRLRFTSHEEDASEICGLPLCEIFKTKTDMKRI